MLLVSSVSFADEAKLLGLEFWCVKPFVTGFYPDIELNA
jgi:hypothetical protein